MPIWGLSQSASPMPTARSMPRLVMASMPSVTVRLRGFGSNSGMTSSLWPAGSGLARRVTRIGEALEKLGDVFGAAHSIGRDRLALPHLDAHVLGVQRGEGILVGDVVADVDGRGRADMLPKTRERLALVAR